MPLLFAATLLLSSALLFLVQPMFAKLVLPRLGGTPAVWNTCQVFFQLALFLGYSYAHHIPRLVAPRLQRWLHFGLLLSPIVVLPISLPNSEPPSRSNPIPWLLWVMAISVGLPFLVVSTTAPLLQRWFAESGHRSAKDPYFLYAASNLGSLIGLIAYPFLLEPSLRLASQAKLWAGLYAGLAVCVVACGLVKPRTKLMESHEPTTWRQRRRWLLLAFVPSSLLLSVTTYCTTDIAAIPLLWVIPLAIYLLTFVLVFAQKQRISHVLLSRLMPFCILLWMLAMLTQATEPVWLLLLMHLGVFFVSCMVCHGELALSRPPAGQLTSFYSWMALGGILGGAFCALLVPLIFPSMIEYPLLMVAACLLRPCPHPDEPEQKSAKYEDLLFPLLLGLLTGGLVLGLQAAQMEHGAVSVGIMFGLPCVLCYLFLHRPIRFGLGIGAVLLGGAFYQGVYGGTIYRARSFFGVHRVTIDPTSSYHLLVHGTTTHGMQSLDPARRRVPLTYYHRSGPLGQLFAGCLVGNDQPVGVIGLGAGSTAAYGKAGQDWRFFEIDPVVERIARNPKYFTFLDDSEAKTEVILGDARLTLQDAPRDYFKLIVVDAFSSDAIPVHLLTKEAVGLYVSRLRDDGLLAFNISNRYLDLVPVLGDLAQSHKLFGLVQMDRVESLASAEGRTSSDWVVLARRLEDIKPLTQPWIRLAGSNGQYLWTDDFANLISVFHW